MNKSSATNIIALLITVAGYFSPIYQNTIFTVGIFALSGSLTNWIAIYMLFEKVPFLYGSGVITNRFKDFKIGIKNLVLEEFFNKKNIEEFFKGNNDLLSADTINSKINFDKVFEELTDAIIESPMGSMLGMFGGREALQPLKEPITAKLKNIISELTKSETSNPQEDFVQSLLTKIEKIIDDRLTKLTPKMVKDIIQKMIRQHLGWLVVWGGIFGGIIGLIFSAAPF